MISRMLWIVRLEHGGASTQPGRRLARVEVLTVESDQLDAACRLALRVFWDEAFGGRFSDEDAVHAYGGVHVLVHDSGRLIAHASAVPRRIRFADSPWRTVGYVEAVATHPERRGEGIGRQVMARLQEEILLRWPLALLSTGTATGFYELLGWQRWRGLSYTQTTTGVVPDGEHGGIMILGAGPAIVPDLSVSVTCEDRAGDAW
jgi:aminoglycoside 2'-N-acetyltransferase I